MEKGYNSRGKGYSKVKAVLLDLDGVITSERIYWNCSGLALAKYLGIRIPDKTGEKIKMARSLLPDDIIQGFKESGINSNWDITYAVSILSKVKKDARWFLEELKKRRYEGMDYLKLLDELDPSVKHGREERTWKAMHKLFQVCYYELEGTDEPVIPLEKIKKALEEMRDMGLKLGIVSGRPYKEAELPLKRWGIWDYFESGLIVTETEVSEESRKRNKHLGKPDPYPILRAIFTHEGRNCHKMDEVEINEVKDDYILVGDSVSDVLAAKNAGIRVICVKTGIASEESLRKAGADVIVDDLSRVPEVVRSFCDKC